MQIVLFIKVVTSILLDKEPNIYLDAQRAAHIDRMRELTGRAPDDSEATVQLHELWVVRQISCDGREARGKPGHRVPRDK